MKTPKYRKHNNRNVAIVEFGGVRRTLPGAYNSEQSLAAYKRFLREYVHADQPPTAATPVSDLTIGELTMHFLDAFGKNRSQARHSRYEAMKNICRKLDRFAGDERAIDFGPKRLKAFREKLLQGGLLHDKSGNATDKPGARSYVNEQIQNVVQVFGWAVEDELLPGTTHHALKAVRGLPKTKGAEIRETDPIKPVPWEDFLATIAELHQPVRDMAWMQYFVGCRSGSMCEATPEQFERGGDVWMWRPVHKTEHLDSADLLLPVGPRCQFVLRHYLDSTQPGQLLFNPQTTRPNRRYGRKYTSESYRQAITRAAERAGVEHWHPHQLRHLRGEQTRGKFGLEASQAVLGHKTLAATQIYTAAQRQKAIAAALEVG